MKGFALAAVMSVAMLAGCGAHASEDARSLDEVAAATRSDPYRFETALEAEGIEDAFTGTATGAADPAEQRGVIRYRFDDPSEGELTMEVRRIGERTYTWYAEADPAVDGTWWEEPVDEADQLIGPFGAFSEPHRAADALAGHGRDVKAGPGEPVDGVATTHYRVTVPTIELLGGGATKERREELEEEIAETGSELGEVEAWAGGDGLLRKLEVEIPVTEDGKTGRFRISMRFFDFGEPVTVEAPPAQGTSSGLLGRTRPCKGEAVPHSAESVIHALREDGFDTAAMCGRDGTVIYGFPKQHDREDDNGGVICLVTRGPDPSEDFDDVVEGNIACFVEPAQQAALRTILDGL